MIFVYDRYLDLLHNNCFSYLNNTFTTFCHVFSTRDVIIMLIGIILTSLKSKTTLMKRHKNVHRYNFDSIQMLKDIFERH